MKRETVIQLIDQWQEGSIRPEDLDLLKEELRANRALLELYVEMAEMHSLLVQAHDAPSPVNEVLPAERIAHLQKRRTTRVAFMAAAALIIISLVVMSFFLVDLNRDATFTLKSSLGSRFCPCSNRRDPALRSR